MPDTLVQTQHTHANMPLSSRCQFSDENDPPPKLYLLSGKAKGCEIHISIQGWSTDVPVCEQKLQTKKVGFLIVFTSQHPDQCVSYTLQILADHITPKVTH